MPQPTRPTAFVPPAGYRLVHERFAPAGDMAHAFLEEARDSMLLAYRLIGVEAVAQLDDGDPDQPSQEMVLDAGVVMLDRNDDSPPEAQVHFADAGDPLPDGADAGADASTEDGTPTAGETHEADGSEEGWLLRLAQESGNLGGGGASMSLREGTDPGPGIQLPEPRIVRFQPDFPNGSRYRLRVWVAPLSGRGSAP